MGLFGKSPERNPKEMVRIAVSSNIRSVIYTGILFQVQEWTHKIRKEGYQLDRQVRGKLLQDSAQGCIVISADGIYMQRSKEKKRR